MKNIFLFLCLLLFSCQKAGKTSMPFWVQANNGNEKSATVSTSDVNGVPLPEKLPKPEQEVATTGSVTISGQLETNNCYKDGEISPCENVTENLANTVILVSAENQTLATTTVTENNSFVLQAQEVDSGNYRVIIENNENRIQYLIDRFVIRQNGNYLEIDDLYLQFFEQVLEANEEINTS
jgi:hypothetical protein